MGTLPFLHCGWVQLFSIMDLLLNVVPFRCWDISVRGNVGTVSLLTSGGASGAPETYVLNRRGVYSALRYTLLILTMLRSFAS